MKTAIKLVVLAVIVAAFAIGNGLMLRLGGLGQ